MRRSEIRTGNIGIFGGVAPLLVYSRQKHKIRSVFIWTSKLHWRKVVLVAKTE